MMFMRNASLSYLFEPAWNASHIQQGKYLHLLNDIMDKLASGVIRSVLPKNNRILFIIMMCMFEEEVCALNEKVSQHVFKLNHDILYISQ